MKNTRNKKVSEKPAGELVKQFSACGNYPIEQSGVEALAKALERSAMDSGIRMQAIIDECMGSSGWCPTPFDLRKLAISMRDKIRNTKAGSQYAEWRRIYGEPDPDWGTKLVQAAMRRGNYKEQLPAMRDESIRAMLFYTEGDGKLLGDREFWEGPRLDGLDSARAGLLRDHPEYVARIRAEGGWRTERERQEVGEPSTQKQGTL